MKKESKTKRVVKKKGDGRFYKEKKKEYKELCHSKKKEMNKK